MKKLSLSVLLALWMVPAFGQVDQNELKLQTIQPETIFAPKGFDSNDGVQIVVYGSFHDVCHKVAPVQYTVDQEKQQVTVKTQAYGRDLCTQMYVSTPYSVVVNLGTLPAGTYELLAVNADGTKKSMGKMPVAPARSPQTDSNLYAQVDEIQFARTGDSGTPNLVVKGTLTNTCLSLSDIRVNLAAGNVCDVLPIASMNGTNCSAANTEFSKIVPLPNFPQTPTLINVRSLGGQSFEKVVSTNNLLGGRF